MMAASSSLKGAKPSRSNKSICLNSSQEVTQHSANDAADDDIKSLTAAELLSDPFGDVYGAEADFGHFVGQEPSSESTLAVKDSSLMLFSPLIAPESPTAPHTLIPSISDEVDPFADIIGGSGAATTDATKNMANEQSAIAAKVESWMTTNHMATALPSTSTLVDLVWGNSMQALDPTQLSMSLTSVATSVAGVNRRASSPSALTCSSTPTKYAACTQCGTCGALERDVVTLATSDIGKTVCCLPTLPLRSTLSISAPTSLRGSLLSLSDEFESSVGSSKVLESVASPRDAFVKRTTQSSRSLSSCSLVRVGDMHDAIGHPSFCAFASATHDAVPCASPLAATPSVHSSIALTKGFKRVPPSASENFDDVDPFTEAGLAASEEVPLAEAPAVWNTTLEIDGLLDEETRTQAGEIQRESSQDDSCDGTGSGSGRQQCDRVNIVDETKRAVAAQANAAIATSFFSNVCDENGTKGGFSQNPLDRLGMGTQSATGEVGRPGLIALTESIEITAATKAPVLPIVKDCDDVIKAMSLRNEGKESKSDVSIGSSDKAVWLSEKEPTVEPNGEVFETSQLEPLAPAAIVDCAEFGDRSNGSSDSFHAFPSGSVLNLARTSIGSDNINRDTKIKAQSNEMQEVTDNAGGNNVSNVEEKKSPPTQARSDLTILDASEWGSVSSPTPVETIQTEIESKESFGDSSGTFADHDFAAFDQSIDSEEFEDFGGFTQTGGTDGNEFTDFQQSDSQSSGVDDDGFGDFAPAVAPTSEIPAIPSGLSAFPVSKTELMSFFKEALATEPIPTTSIAQLNSQDIVNSEDKVQDLSTETVRNVFRSIWNEYISSMGTNFSSASLSSATGSSTNTEHGCLDRKTSRASKYLKYVLSEKIQEASRPNGIFPHGSERHAMYLEYAASGDADRMRTALTELHEALFHSSVNEAMMRIAKQAALSAKAKIAEQAAQYASSRSGSLFSTTRQLLARGGSASGAHGPGSSGNDNSGDHAGADTPTGASVQKLARYSFPTSQDDTANGHRGATSGEERASEGSDHTGHSSGSDSEAATNAGDSRTRSQILSSSNGGLMKKFQDRFSFTGSRHRRRFVNLRRQGQSSEEVRKMELNLDAISGGLDEVKWKCAMFLYDVKEVAHVAPSQIIILSFPSKQPLTGKTDRSALTKLVKPHTIWTVNIGANHSDMLNELLQGRV